MSSGLTQAVVNRSASKESEADTAEQQENLITRQ